MTEAEWVACTDPQAMLEFLRGRASHRKRLLFAAASFRRLRHLLPDRRQHRGVELLEEMAEGTTPMGTRSEVIRKVRHALPPDNFVAGAAPADHPYYVALMLYRAIVSTTPAEHAWQATAGLADGAVEQRAQSSLLRDIFGNPFRPLFIDPTWCRWQDGTIQKLAQGVYDDRAFDRLPILADALEEAGCSDAELLAHLRGPGPHTRGCWPGDLLLGKR
jgi:hypothetical protein